LSWRRVKRLSNAARPALAITRVKGCADGWSLRWALGPASSEPNDQQATAPAATAPAPARASGSRWQKVWEYRAVAIEVRILADKGDDRGRSYELEGALGWLGAARDVHVMSIRPDHDRGHHYHEHKREILIVEHQDRWRLLWDEGNDSAPQSREFQGRGAAMILIPPGCSHAIENSGDFELRVTGLSNIAYDATNPDARRRALPKSARESGSSGA